MYIPALAIHGGSGIISKSQEYRQRRKKYHHALRQALDQGFDLLSNHNPALEVVTRVVCLLEDCELFNAGKGSVYTAKGDHRMDAAVMEGTHGRAGAVAGIQGIKNPVLLAKAVMQKTPFVFISGDEALELAHSQELECKPSAYFDTPQRYEQLQQAKELGKVQLDHSENDEYGTVGAVAVDTAGHVAAATSTGGLTNKTWGRIGDSPIIGAGTYAKDQTCAVSCTGHGEYFIRAVAAYDLSCRMEYGGLPLHQAAADVINKQVHSMGGRGGLIAVDASGNIAMPFSTQGMYRGMKNDHTSFTQIY